MYYVLCTILNNPYNKTHFIADFVTLFFILPYNPAKVVAFI